MTRAEQRGRRPRVTQIEGGAGTSWTTGKLDSAFRAAEADGTVRGAQGRGVGRRREAGKLRRALK